MLGGYHQAFMNSNFLADFGFTEGYRKTNSIKKQETSLISFQNLLKISQEMTTQRIALIYQFKMYQMINI